MSNSIANSSTMNLLPVQAYFNADGTFNTFVGQGQPFTVSFSGGSITNATINNSSIGATTPSTGAFTSLSSTADATIHGLTVGLGSGSVGTNVVLGNGLSLNATGARNAVFGNNALLYNTASDNSAFGNAALFSNTTGSYNTVLGGSALALNTTASNNTAVGYQAGYSNTTGYSNIYAGYQAGYTNSTGVQNTAFGHRSLYYYTGNNAVAIGFQAGFVRSTNTDGYGTVFIGYNTGSSTTTGSDNVFVGGSTGLSNSTGNQNTALGSAALYSNTTASNNTAVGYQASYTGTTGQQNTTMGWQSGYSNSTGSNNAFYGYYSGQNTISSNNTFIGNGAGYQVTSGAKNTILGNYNGNFGGLDIRTANNYIVLSDGDGNPMAYAQNGGGWYQKNNSASWSITSDIRIKKNVESLESGLNVINALRPVEFDYIANDKHDIGFIAQEYQTVLPTQVSEGENGMLSLNQNLVPYLVKAIQELTAEIQFLKSQLGVK